MQLGELVTMRPTLENIASKEMVPAAALEFAKFLREILMEIQTFERKRAELFQTYGEFTGEGEEKRLQILPENEEVFNDIIKEALAEEVEVPMFDVTKLSVDIAPTDLVNVVGLFK